MDRFVHDQNLTRYIDLHETVTDPTKLAQIEKLLIEEEDRFGSVSERLNEADRLIHDGHGRVRRHRALVAHLDAIGHDTKRAGAVLASMSRLLEIMYQYRQTLSDGLDRADI